MYYTTQILETLPKNLGQYGYVKNGTVTRCEKITPAFARKNELTHAGLAALNGLFHVEVKTDCFVQSFNAARSVPVGTSVKLPHYRDAVPGFGKVVGIVPAS